MFHIARRFAAPPGRSRISLRSVLSRNLRRVAAAASAVFLLLAGPAPHAEEMDFAKSALSIVSGGKTYDFQVELAVTPRQQARGLMWRTRVGRDEGMLFIYPRDKVILMWMKNTLVPLDMVFIDRDGKIVSIKERMVPRSLKVISSGGRARAVLELAGGTASRLGLKPGDTVRHPAFGAR